MNDIEIHIGTKRYAVSTETFSKVLNMAAYSLRALEKDEGKLPASEDKALHFIMSLQSHHSELI